MSSLLPVQSLIAMIDIIDNLGMDILPYIVLLIVPLLGRMSDQAENVRLVATNCFATLIRYMPLEVSVIFVSYTQWTKMNSTALKINYVENTRFFYQKLRPGHSCKQGDIEGRGTRIAMRERGDMRPPSQRTASFAVEARWKLTCFWKSRFRFELEFHKVSTI